MNVQFLDLKLGYQELKDEIDIAVQCVMESGVYVLGNEVDTFEREWAEYVGAKYAIGVSSGLSALELALKAIGISSNDEVILPSNTFIATWMAASNVGAKIVPVEPDLRTGNIDPELIEKKISNRTKAILIVHLYGQPANLNKIIEIAEKYKISIIEDAAQAHGAKYNNERIGAHSDAVCWSFYPGKNLGAMGDAGAITTNNHIIEEKIKQLRNYGSEKKYINKSIGYNARLDPMQAAILRIKLKYLDEWNSRRTEIATLYTTQLKDCRNMVLPYVEPFATHAWHIYAIRINNRNELKNKLADLGVETLIHYPVPPHLQKAYVGYNRCRLPIAKKISNETLSLPIGPHLDLKNAMYVIKCLKDIL